MGAFISTVLLFCRFLRMHHLLWFIVLARLMIPVLPESSFSLFTWISLASNGISVTPPLSSSIEPEVT
ncbi:hypothetical protein ACFVS2_05005 [Brevibacillus sp. NPDC058079]|uniref:hypothetical protein n=1 Tax=Brevibacillus sp. NPDC058079 TaxID=3346330 RepID=UPI0036E73626